MSRAIRLGIIGAGGIVRTRHLPGLRAQDGVQVVAVCNRSRESSAAVAAEWGIPEIASDWRSVVERPDLDAVLIGTWPYTHAEMSIAALDAGKHVFCQARMARDAREARQMLDAARRRPDLVAMLCPPPMGMLGDRFVRRLLREGFLGELRTVHAAGRSNAFVDVNAPLHWRQDFELQGYNTLTLGMWAEVVHRWVGLHESVSAETAVFTPRRREGDGAEREVRIADAVAIAARLRCGAIASYEFTGVAHHPPANTIQLYGTRGTLRYDLDTDVITLGDADDARPSAVTVPLEERRPWSVEADFIQAVRAGGPVEPSFEDGVHYMEFTEAVYRSAARGRRIALPLTGPDAPEA